MTAIQAVKSTECPGSRSYLILFPFYRRNPSIGMLYIHFIRVNELITEMKYTAFTDVMP